MRDLSGRRGDASLSAADGSQEEHIALVEAYYREQGLFHTADATEAEYSATISLDLATVEPWVAGPKRPQDRVLLPQAGGRASWSSFRRCLGRTRISSWCGRWCAGRVRAARLRRSGDVTQRVGAPAPVVEAPLVPVITIGKMQAGAVLEAPQVSIKSRFGIDPDQYLDHGSDRDRGDYSLYEYLESLRDDRGWFAGEEGC